MRLRTTLLFAASLFLMANSASATLVVAGSDFLHTTAPTTFGGAPFLGVPISPGAYPGYSQPMGDADTIIQRQSDANFPVPGGPVAVSLQMIALQLVSAIPVDFGLGTDFYYITLQSTRGGPASTGNMNMFLNPSEIDGTMDTSIDVFFDVRKGALNGPIALSNDLVLSQTGGTWTSTPTGVLVPGTYPDDTVNLHTNLVSGQIDFFPGPLTETHPTGATHSVTVATTPEPASMLMVGGGLLLAGLVMRKRKSKS